MLYDYHIIIDGSMVIIVSDRSIIHALDLSRSLSATLWLLGGSSTTLSNTFFFAFFWLFLACSFCFLAFSFWPVVVGLNS